MTMATTNGRHSFALEDEGAWESPESLGFAAGEEEDEWTGETGFESTFEGGFGETGFESTLEDEWTGETGFESTLEDEWTGETGGAWETHEALGYTPGSFEDEWTGEAAFEGGGLETGFESAFEGGSYESAFEGAFEDEDEDESDQFLPFLAPLAMKALPMIAKFALPAVKRLLPVARRAVQNVVRNVTSTPLPPSMRPVMRGISALQGGQGRRVYRRRRPAFPMGGFPGGFGAAGGGFPGMPGMPAFPGGFPDGAGAPTPAPAPMPAQPSVGTLLRQLSQLLNVGEAVAAEAEASFFGSNEFQTELGAHEFAHEAALTEVLAAEASHATTEAEAESLLGSALPVTIRIMGGAGSIRPLIPTLTRSNARLVSAIRRSGPGSQQLLRTVPTIQRRTIASIRAARRAGRPVGPRMVPQIMAGQAARVLGSPHVCGRSLLRNAAIRRGTVAPAGRVVRAVRAY